MKHIIVLDANEAKALELMYMGLDSADAAKWPDDVQNGLLSAGAKLHKAVTLEAVTEKKELVA